MFLFFEKQNLERKARRRRGKGKDMMEKMEYFLAEVNILWGRRRGRGSEDLGMSGAQCVQKCFGKQSLLWS
jgi:hypothetical protein